MFHLNKKILVLFLHLFFIHFSQAHTLDPQVRGPYSGIQECTPASSEDSFGRLRYFHNLFTEIVEKNRDIFKDSYEKDLFCINVSDEKNFGGFAEPNKRTLTMRYGSLLYSKNDAQVAAVLSHELAHILLQHDHPERLEPLLEASPEFIELNQKRLALRSVIENHRQEVRWLNSKIFDLKKQNPMDEKQILELENKILENQSQIDALSPDYQSLLKKYFKLQKKLAPMDQSMGWREQEADELGFFLYLKAGFHPEDFYQAFFEMMSEDERSVCESQYLSKISEPSPPHPPRIKGSLAIHPESCFRVFNLMYLEQKKHWDLYSPLLESAKLKTLFPGELEKLKSTL